MPDMTTIGLDKLHESPSNPRKTYGDLEELTNNVRAMGVLQPVLARPHPKHDGHYELVFGSRRYRAAKAAGLAQLPAMVRTMDDVAVAEAQLVENCHREDVHPLEEADAYRALHEDHGYPVEELAAKVGKSKGYIYGRMKLCALSDRAREVYLAGKMTASTALLVARIPVAKLQDQAAKELEDAYGWDHHPMSAREAADDIQRRFMLRLKDAPFRTADEGLVPEAGACTTCSHRTGNQPELFADVDSADVCTNPPCFKSKIDALWKVKKTEAKKAGQEIIEKKKDVEQLFRFGHGNLPYGSDYVDLSARCYDDPKNRAYKTLLKGHMPPVTLARDQDGRPHELIKKKDATKALKAAGHDFTKQASTPTGARKDPYLERQRREREVERRATRRAMGELVAKIEQANPTVEFWRELAGGIVESSWQDTLVKVAERRGIDVPKRSDLEAGLKKATAEMTLSQLQGFAFELTLRDAAFGGPNFRAACKRYGIDFSAVKKEESKAFTAEKKEKAAAKKKRGASKGAAKGKAPAKKRASSSTRSKGKRRKTPRPGGKPDVDRCRVCGCSDEEACEGGCTWVESDLCSTCAEAAE